MAAAGSGIPWSRNTTRSLEGLDLWKKKIDSKMTYESTMPPPAESPASMISVGSCKVSK